MLHFGFPVGSLRLLCLLYVTVTSLPPPLLHMYFYHCFGFQSLPNRHLACSVSIHVYSLFYLAVVYLYGLMTSPPSAVCRSSFIRFAMLSYGDAPWSLRYAHVLGVIYLYKFGMMYMCERRTKTQVDIGHRLVDHGYGLCFISHDADKLLLVDLAVLVEIKLINHRL